MKGRVTSTLDLTGTVTSLDVGRRRSVAAVQSRPIAVCNEGDQRCLYWQRPRGGI